ncbi:MAG TPA: hypothetical protein VHW65_03555 [Gemmatimonadales bacterium]|jgi:hypothetical protein|nr:hypothetical protein [Gemmatimonadales bacterium]
MRGWVPCVAAACVIAACGGHANAPSVGDSTAIARHQDDSVVAFRTQQAPALADTARRTLTVLLKHPETAFFDSVVVVLPPKEDGRWPAAWVCGRIGGKPGVGGRSTPTPFIYRNAVTAFVLDQNNGQAFAALRARSCDNPGARVLLR